MDKLLGYVTLITIAICIMLIGVSFTLDWYYDHLPGCSVGYGMTESRAEQSALREPEQTCNGSYVITGQVTNGYSAVIFYYCK